MWVIIASFVLNSPCFTRCMRTSHSGEVYRGIIFVSPSFSRRSTCISLPLTALTTALLRLRVALKVKMRVCDMQSKITGYDAPLAMIATQLEQRISDGDIRRLVECLALRVGAGYRPVKLAAVWILLKLKSCYRRPSRNVPSGTSAIRQCSETCAIGRSSWWGVSNIAFNVWKTYNNEW